MRQPVEKKCFVESDHNDSYFDDDDDDFTTSPGKKKLSQFCQDCGKTDGAKLICYCCNASFRWCCAGYSRKPMDDPSYPFTEAKVALVSFCATCLDAKGITQDAVLAQEDEYFALVKYFEPAAGMGWRWIPGVGDEFSMFSVVWLHLQQSNELCSPFFCGIGSGFDDVTLQKDPMFLAFVSQCAEEALSFVEATGDWAEYVRVWSAIQCNPASVPQYLHSEALTYVGNAIAQYLHNGTDLRIWKFDASCRLLKMTASFGSGVAARKIDILLRNNSVERRFDLIVPRHESTDSVLF
jgi:hypothetical protein